MTIHRTAPTRSARGAGTRPRPGLPNRNPQFLPLSPFRNLQSAICSLQSAIARPHSFLLLAAFCLLSATAPAAVWTATGLDLLEAEAPPVLDNVRVDHDGTLRLTGALVTLAELEADAAWRVVAGPGGRWYAGTGSGGRLYTGGREPTLAAELEEGEILALLHDARAGLVFGLTPGGVVHRLRPDGTVETRFETGEDYVHALLAGPGGEVYIATGPAGRLYRLPPVGPGQVVFTAPQAHIASLAWLEPGRVLLAGTSPDGLIYRLDLGPAGPEVSVLYDTPADEIRALAVTRGAVGIRVHAAANPGENNDEPGGVFCVAENGTLAWQWTAPAGAVFDLIADGDEILAATGNEGIIYALDDLGRAGIRHKLPVGRVLCLAPGPDGILVGTSEPAAVFRLDPGLAGSGLAESPVRDCDGPATFGRVGWRAEVPSGASIALETRSGNSATPDSTWSAWRAADGTVRSRPARFIQWRARFGSTFPGRTPALERVDLHYAIPNRPPAVRDLTLEPTEPADAARGAARPVRGLAWEPGDPDGDSLEFELSYRPEGHPGWLLIETGLAEPSYQLDTRQLPDGWYRFRVEATDAPSRPAAEALRAEAVSPPVLIDNGPPRITGLRLDGERLRFTVSDEHSVIVAARVSVNAGPWQPVGPVDRLFDSLTEEFAVAPGLVPGTNHIVAWAADAHGNTATAALTVRSAR